jgi:hypothetical protein
MTAFSPQLTVVDAAHQGPPDSSRTTRRLLMCGVIAGVLFVGVSFLQAISRHGFNAARQPLSLLLLGDLGWIQLINFEATGVLAIAYAVGVHRRLRPGRAATWGAILIGAWGAGLIIAGAFGPDPSMGFPPGAPPGNPPTMTTHSLVHGIGFAVSLVSLIGACAVFARRSFGRRERGWSAYCVATAVLAPALIVISGIMMPDGRGGTALFALAIVMALWIVLIAAHLLTD